MNQPTVNEIEERAYLLWEQDGCPANTGNQYWLLAESQLQSLERSVTSGAFGLVGFGSFEEVLKLAVLNALDSNDPLELTDTITVRTKKPTIDNGVMRVYTEVIEVQEVETMKVLRLLGKC